MHTYTNQLSELAYGIYPDDDDYFKELAEAMTLFREFPGAFGTFLTEHGYDGEPEDTESRISYVRRHFVAAGIKAPRGIEEWFGEKRRVERKTAFQLCFAFHLNVEETEDFFRRVMLQRGFDFHEEEEILWYFAIKKGLGYQEFKEMREHYFRETAEPVKKMGEELSGNTGIDTESKGQNLYTAAIAESVKSITSSEELLAYLRENHDCFGCHNVTAYHFVRKLWDEIAAEDGLAAKERSRIYQNFDLLQNVESDSNPNDCRQSLITRNRKPAEQSIWSIYLQILGLLGNANIRSGIDRSVKPILRDQSIMHPLVLECFPDRDGLNKIRNGITVSNERVRKMLVLLVFYRFWVRIALRKGAYFAKGAEAGQSIADIDGYLLDCGYPALYAGNPFDWVILNVSASETPLLSFREYMQELFYGEELWIEESY